MFYKKIVRIFKKVYQDPLAAPGKVFLKLKIYFINKYAVFIDNSSSTYAKDINGKNSKLFSLPPLAILKEHAPTYALLVDKTLKHEFDLLGSGWINLQRGLQRKGLIPNDGGGQYAPQEAVCHKIFPEILAAKLHKTNRPKAIKLWQKITSNYMPISWNEDFKCGWIWPTNIYSKMQKYGDKSGADIKVPWELSRMHHLPWLALAAYLASNTEQDFVSPKKYVEEFQNQVFDFAASCPPRCGANWVCTMDVAIRASNMIAAYDFFCDQGIIFEPSFQKEFLRIINDHFIHIVNNLEYQPLVRANHYYSDIAGLVIVSAWLPKTASVVAALAWGINEFFKETALQFHADGSNFEASTSYHRLCSELMFYALAIIKGLESTTLAALKTVDKRKWKGRGYYAVPKLETIPEQNEDGIVIPDEVLNRVWYASNFSLSCRMEDGELVQIGDNDSGRFFKFLPAINADGLEIINEHSHILAAAFGLTNKENLRPWANLPDAHIMALLAHENELVFAAREDIHIQNGWTAYSDFGLYFKEQGQDILCVRCGHNGQYDNGGHAHNDQLSLAFSRAGLFFLVDPGTYVYTPVPAWRNALRSTRHHNTVFMPKLEQNNFSDLSLFSLENQAKPRLLELKEHYFCAEHTGFGFSHRRTLSIEHGKVKIKDTIQHNAVCNNEACNNEACNNEACNNEARIALHFHPEVHLHSMEKGNCILERNNVLVKLVLSNAECCWEKEAFIYSAGYGQKQLALRLISSPFSQYLEWEIS